MEENETLVSGGDVLSDSQVTLYADTVMVVSASEETVASGTGSGYQLPEYFVNYFSGYLANMDDTEYIAFSERVYDSNSNYSYVDNYYLIYDLETENDAVLNGTYPCLHIYRSSSNSSYYNVTKTTYSLTEYPSFVYGSVMGAADLRKGVTHYETYALLFFFAFLVLYIIMRDIFKHVPMFERKSK